MIADVGQERQGFLAEEGVQCPEDCAHIDRDLFAPPCYECYLSEGNDGYTRNSKSGKVEREDFRGCSICID